MNFFDILKRLVASTALVLFILLIVGPAFLVFCIHDWLTGVYNK